MDVPPHHNVRVEPESSTWWLARWVRSETFWQGIAAQTLGTLAAAVILAMVAIFIGIGYTPAVRYFVIFGLVILFAILLEIALAVFIVRFSEKAVSKTRLYQRHPFSTGLLFSPFAVVALFLTWNGAIFLIAFIRPAIARWTGYSG
jgi:hypothetical protein